jgi:multidrug resistance efflux pump
VSQSSLDEARSALEQAENRQRAAARPAGRRTGRGRRGDRECCAGARGVERAEEELANSTIRAPIRATVLTRDVEVGSPVSSILNLGANATP